MHVVLETCHCCVYDTPLEHDVCIGSGDDDDDDIDFLVALWLVRLLSYMTCF